MRFIFCGISVKYNKRQLYSHKNLNKNCSKYRQCTIYIQTQLRSEPDGYDHLRMLYKITGLEGYTAAFFSQLATLDTPAGCYLHLAIVDDPLFTYDKEYRHDQI